MSAFAFGCRCLLIGVFAVSAVSKVRGGAALREFADSLVRMRLLRGRWAGGRWAVRGAALIAGVEAVVVVLLAVPATVQLGFLAAVALLTALTAGLAWVVATGAAAPCRCFGRSREPVGWSHVVRNGLLFAVAVAGGSAAFAAPGTPGIGPAAVALVVASVGVVGVVFFDDLKFLFTGSAHPVPRR